METPTFSDLTVVWLIGIFFVGLFLVVRLGLIKSWFILKTLPGLLSARMIYAFLPGGLFFIALGIAAMIPAHTLDEGVNLIIYFSFPFIALALLCLVWVPNWVKPHWLQWLEREYGYCLDILIEEGQKMGRWEWEARVRTQAGMEAWVDEICEQRREEIDLLWHQMSIHLLLRQAEADGRLGPSFGERIKGYVPDHRREWEEERIQQELEEYEEIHKHKRK